MIYDHLSNIENYKGLSEDIYKGLFFLKQATSDMECGTYQLNSRVKATVSDYETKEVNEHGYEAHKKYIDIQCVLKGQESVACLPIEKLMEIKPYSEEKDAAFYMAVSKLQPLYVKLQSGYFAIFYPQDGHMPKLSVNEAEIVKKVVIKVEIA